MLRITLFKNQSGENHPHKLLKVLSSSGKIAYSNLKNIDLTRVSTK